MELKEIVWQVESVISHGPIIFSFESKFILSWWHIFKRCANPESHSFNDSAKITVYTDKSKVSMPSQIKPKTHRKPTIRKTFWELVICNTYTASWKYPFHYRKPRAPQHFNLMHKCWLGIMDYMALWTMVTQTSVKLTNGLDKEQQASILLGLGR